MHVALFAIRTCALAVLCCLAVADVRARRLPNRLVFAAGALYVVQALACGASWQSIAMHGAAGLGAFALCLGLFSLGAMGGGDVKLAAVVFLWSGLQFAPATLWIISATGMLVALLGLAARRIDKARSPAPRPRWLRVLALFSCERGVPYGVALATGGAAVIVAASSQPALALLR